MRFLLFLLTLPLLAAPPEPARYQPAFADEFDGTALDEESCSYRLGPRHWSEQKPQTVAVKAGLLHLVPRKEKAGSLDYTAGGMISRQAFGCGFYDARLKMPAGRGWHTSFWMIRNGPKQGLGDRFPDPHLYIWGGAVVRGDDRKDHISFSRWARSWGYRAWVTHSEIAHAVNESSAGPCRPVSVALPQRNQEFWDGLITHNPTILRIGSCYRLCCMRNTGDGKAIGTLNWTHRNNQRIADAVAESPDGPWQRFDGPLLSVSANANAPDALMVSNSTVARRPDGGLLLLCKAGGRQRPLPFGRPLVHFTATADSPTGSFTKQYKPIFLASGIDFPAEDPFVWYDHATRRYYAVVRDNNGHFTNAGKSLALWESPDGFGGELAPHALVSRRELPWVGGGVRKFHSLERPQVLFVPDDDSKQEHS